MYSEVLTAVSRRGLETVTRLEIPGWGFLLAFANIIIYAPIFLVLHYTWDRIYPVLAMVEDPAPPAYEPIALANEDASINKNSTAPANVEASLGTPAVTSSFRNIGKTLKSISGFRSYFRGFACYAALNFTTAIVFSFMAAGSIFSVLILAPIAAIALCQLDTAWVHIVISQPSPKRFYQRLPPFKQTVKATALPSILYFVAMQFAAATPRWVAAMVNLVAWDVRAPTEVPEANATDLWKWLLILVVFLAVHYLAVVPAHVVLVRIQASLLPEEDETIIPFDRSFQGLLEPAVVGGKGFVSIKDAWATFSRESWTRLIKLYVKIFALSCAVTFAFLLFLMPQVWFVFAHSKEVEVPQ